ncbi:Alpha-L-Rha alpha-1,3-L-rhamnosyltransferase [hydrothermal vent metagenome]|uniref:Alpha-L-Rha alpha-1,3-L-rhamnosyltransferase n=1 Tax=hydrothermal vent metagenome TaxID=652676 RepID=A0A3B0WTD3_9ZZZZ
MSVNLSPNIAVLLAAYNGRQWIEEQVNSILFQKKVRVHLFISVDLSSDGTYEWCKEFENKHSNVTVLEYGELFGGAAKNFFRLIRDVDFSSYDFVAFSDQDDIWLDNKLSHACKMITSKQLDVYSSDVIAVWEDGREKLVKKSYPQKQFDYLFEAGGPGCTYVFRHDVLQLFKCFLINNWSAVNQISLHDWMIYAFYRSQGNTWYIDNQPLMYYRQHASNQVGFNFGLKAYFTRLMMSKWYRTEVEKIFNLTAPAVISLDRITLIKQFCQLRRRPRDVVALLIMLVVRVF